MAVVFCLRWRMCVLRAAILLVLWSPLSCGQQCTDSAVCQTPFLNLTSSTILLTVSSTCGDPNATTYVYPDSLNTAATCTAGMHPKEHMLDATLTPFGNLTFSYPILTTYWQSENSVRFVNDTPMPEYVVINFTDVYLIYTLSIVFASPNSVATQSSLADMRPLAMQIQNWNSDSNSWITWRRFADNCLSRYPGSLFEDPASSTTFGPLASVCMQKFYSGDESTISRSGSGLQEVQFSPARDFMGIFDSDLNTQRHFMTSAIRLQFDYPAKDSPLLSYYAIASLSIDWKCSCFGHASACTQGRCDCKQNTMGYHCDQCMPQFNDRPWKMGVVGENASLSICQDCSCNAYAASCHYDTSVSHGICDNCTSNTAGDKCESCAEYFYVNPNWNPAATYAPCTGFAADPIIPLTYNCFERCIPCNCGQVGTIPGEQLNCDRLSGNCSCKPYVQGRACDTCKDGYWNLGIDSFSGCTGCDCEPSGSLNSINYCDHGNGTCICKNNTQGTRCDQCKVGFFDIDITKPDGCTPCDCDVGASLNLMCPAAGGACMCKPFIAGRTCRNPYDNYFGAVLDYLTTEAEFSTSILPADIVERYGAGEVNATNTGRGFVNFVAPRSLTLSLIVPFQSLFQVVVRYETTATWTGVQGIVQLTTPATGPTTPYNCNTSATYLSTASQQVKADIPPKATAGAVALGTVCLLANLPYTLRLDFFTSTPLAASILVDSVVLIPDFSTSSAYLLSNDSTKAQMTQCSKAQQSIDMSAAQNLSCPQLGYSIMVDKYTRAYDCNCNITGSTSTLCSPIGGQCICKPNIFLRDCSQCKVNSYGFSSGVGCTQCNCDPNGSTKSACNETGLCSCKTNVQGDKCNVCIPQYWGVFTGNGCQPCVCNMIYATDMNCMDSGQCNCLPGVGGIQCDRCADGFYRLTSLGCTACGCSYYGSTSINCGQSDGHCACKAQTVGSYCDTCTAGYFGLGPWGNDGCIKCFCSGHSNVCTSAFGWYAVSVNTSLDLKVGAVVWTNEWTCVDQVGNPVTITDPTLIGLDGTAVRVMTIDNDFNGTLFYFVAPDVFLGDKRSAYGQYLNISMILSFPPPEISLIPVPTSGDVFIQGNYTSFTLVTSLPVQPSTGTYTPYSLRLHESVWFLNSSTSLIKVQATYENMMQVLASVAFIKVRATFFKPSVMLNASMGALRTGLVSASLTYASINEPTTGDQVLVNNVEECVCPAGYQGQFCEFCAPGFTRMNPGAGLFSTCVPCFCNNHQLEGTSCDASTGACNCTDKTTGINCELCLDGYFGYPASGRLDSCQPCSCPGNVVAAAVNSFARTCHNDGLGSYVCDNCTGGANGSHCDTCGDGYFGTPTDITNNNGFCSSCLDPSYCYGNAWYNQTCNSITGDCRGCLFSTMGRNCETCMPYYWGSGVYRSCQPCNCNATAPSVGRTGDCDKASGFCLCRENVTSIAANCDTCILGFYNLSNVNGCLPCNCFSPGFASLSAACDPVTGRCACYDKYTGRTCDTCKNGTWNPNAGCVDCACLNGSRSLVCDPFTGQCPCSPGYTGRQCTVCEAGKNASLPFIGNLTLGYYPNCTACGDCYDHLASTVSQLGINMQTSYFQMMTLWLISFNNMSYDSISAQVALIASNLNTTWYHVGEINTWFPLFQEIQGNFSLISTNMTNYWRIANGNNGIIRILQLSLGTVRLFTGRYEVTPGVFIYPADLAQQIQTVTLIENNAFNVSSDAYQNIVMRVNIVTNVNGTVSGLQARVKNALLLVQNSLNVRTQAELLLNISTTSWIANDAHIGDISVGVSALQVLNSNDQASVAAANVYLDAATVALNQVTNWSLNTEGTIYNMMRDAQNIGSSALNAQRSANASVATVNSFLSAATGAKQLISGNVVSLADALRTLGVYNAILASINQIAINIGLTSLDTLQSTMTNLVQQINSTNIPLDKVSSINTLAQQSLQLAAAAQASTQQDLIKAQNVVNMLDWINSNLTSAQAGQQVAQAGLTNATNTIGHINTIITLVTQKGTDAQAQANQTESDISSSTNAIHNLQQTFPTLAQRFSTARSVGEFAAQSAESVALRAAGNANASVVLQAAMDAKSLLISQQKATLQSIQVDLDSIQLDLNSLISAYNLLGTRDEAIQQDKDMNTLTSDLINLNALLDQLQRQIDTFNPDSTYCNV